MNDRLRVGPVLRESRRQALAARRAHLVYGAFAGLAGSVLLAPAGAWILTKVLVGASGGSVVNVNIADLVLSLHGLLLFVLWAALVGVVVVIAVAGHAFLAALAGSGRRPRLRDVVWHVAADLRRVPGRGAVRMALLAALGLPLIGAVTTALAGVLLLPFGRGAELRDIVPRGLPVPLWTVAAGMAVMFVLFAWLYVRWSLAIPILTLEGKTLTEATRLSAQRIKGSFRRVGLAHLIHYVQMALLLALLTGLLRLAGRPLVAALFEREGGAGAFGVAALLITFYVLVWVLGVLGTARVVTLTVLHHLALGGTVSRVDLTATPEELRRARVRFSLLALASAAAFGVAAWLTVPRVEKELVRAGNPITVTAHRGASIEAPENTIAAVRGAIEAGADFAEIDVQQAGDGTIVVVHDANLKRLAGVDVNVWQAPYEALAKLDVGSHHSKAFAGERIPTLEQTLDFARDKIRLNIELKTNKNENERFIPDLVDLLRKKDWFERCIVTSLELHFLQQVRKLEPKVRIGIIITAKVGAGHDLDVDIYSVQPLIATSDFIRRAHADGREVHVWTVNERADMERFADRAADSLITDAPKLARQVLDARTPADGLRGAARRLFGLD